jgi:hypothetical protein
MQIRPSMTLVALLMAALVSPAVQAIEEPSLDARVTATAISSRAHLAQLPAPVGHRQPTRDDLPEWLREEENPSEEANPSQAPQAGTADVEQGEQHHGQRRKSRIQPDDGVPRICDPC